MNIVESAILTLLSGDMVPSDGFPAIPWSLNMEDEGDGSYSIDTVIRNYGRPTLKIVITRIVDKKSAVLISITNKERCNTLVTCVPEILELLSIRYIRAKQWRDEDVMRSYIYDLELSASQMRLANGG